MKDKEIISTFQFPLEELFNKKIKLMKIGFSIEKIDNMPFYEFENLATEKQLERSH